MNEREVAPPKVVTVRGVSVDSERKKIADKNQLVMVAVQGLEPRTLRI